MKSIEELKSILSSIPNIIDEDDHKKVSRVMTFFWVIYHVTCSGVIIWRIIGSPLFDDMIFGTVLVILQLMITKISDTCNRMYDTVLGIQNNTMKKKDVILLHVENYSNLVRNIEVSEKEHHVDIINNVLRDDLQTYKKNTCFIRILTNAILLKSMEPTPMLEKDAIKENLEALYENIKNEPRNHVTCDTSPNDASLNKVAI